jgi:hypothetical protein
MPRRNWGLLATAAVLAAGSASAQTAQQTDLDKVEQMQRQMQQLQDQMKQVNKDLAEAKKKAAEVKTAESKSEVPPAFNGAYGADLKPFPTKAPALPFGLQFSMAGTYIALDGAWRSSNELASASTSPPFGTIPLQNSPLYNQKVFGLSAQSSRIALKATGDIDPTQHVKGYFEMDFLGAATTANSRETNSYTPRIRQGFFEYDNDNWGFHLVAGQSWSLLTPNRVGMLPNNEATPTMIDAQNYTGFNWARQPEIRFVKEFNKVVWFGVAVAASSTNFAGNGVGVADPPGFSAANGLVTPPGINVNGMNTCNAAGLLDDLSNCSTQIAPDIIEKIAFDPGWGHYEAVGLQRWFSDSINIPALPGAAWSQRDTFGWGVGGNALIPVVTNLLDVQGNVLYGDGIGRYGSAQLADVTIGPTGNLQPLMALQWSVGAVAHPWAGFDLYAYYGQESVQGNSWNVGGVNGGYGNAFFSEACGLQSLASTNGGPTAPGNATGYNGNTGTCAGNVHSVKEITVGFWQDFYKGPLGRLRYGVQYENIQQELFSGLTTIAGANTGLNPSVNVVMFSLRYYPFN